MRRVLQNLYEKAWPSRWGPPLALTTLFMSFLWFGSHAQTTLISAVGDGGFEGATPAASNWVAVNSSNDSWVTNTAASSVNGTRAAYITSNSAGAPPPFTYSQTSTIQHLYYDVTIPVGQPIVQLTFNWRVGGEGATASDWDNLKVFWGLSSSITPAANTAVGAGFQVSGPGAVSGMYKLNSAGFNSETISFSGIPGQTYRLVFSWKSDVSDIANPPAAIDAVNLVSSAPANFTATAAGGMWSSPATWVGGAVPGAGNDITIPANSTVYVDQALNYRDYSISGTMAWGSGTHTMVATGNVTVNAGGRFLGYNSAGGGQAIQCLGSFTSNGFANLVVSAVTFGGTGAAALGGGSLSNYYNNGTHALLSGLQVQNSGSLNVALPFNVRTLNPWGGTITGGSNITLDNTQAQTYGPTYRGLFYAGITTVANMGTGYTTAPVIASGGAQNWAAGIVALGAVRVNNGQQYVCVVNGTASIAPTHNTNNIQDPGDGVQWLHVGPVGDIGTALASTATLAPTAGTVYFWNGTLYRCRVAGAINAANITAALPLSTVPGTDVVIGAATFRVVGTVARLSPNYDATAQNLRGVNIVSAGTGIVTSPAVTVLNTGAGTGATVTVLLAVPAIAGPANTLVQKNATGLITGTPVISSSTGIGEPTVGDGGLYLTTPSVFISPPSSTNSNLNYIQLSGASGGSGCTVAPTSIQFTGGTFTTGTQTFTVTIRGGRIVSLTYTGTALYSSPPTGITMTGGTFAVAPVFPNAATLAAVCARATANLDVTGAISSFTLVNAGSNYNASPTLSLTAAVAGEVAAATPTARVSLYNLTASFFNATAINGNTPATVNGVHNEATNLAGLVPSSRIISVLSSGTSQGITFTGNVTLNANAPLILGGGPIDMGGNDMIWRSLTYTGTSSTATSWVSNGRIESFFTGTGPRSFPFRAQGLSGAVQLNAGTGLGPAGGDNIGRIRVSQTTAPSDGALSMRGNRAFRVEIITGAAFGTNPTMLLGWDPNDNIVSDQAGLLMAQSNTALSSGWTVRSVTSGTGALPATGTRPSATTGVGPIVFASSMFFGWSTSFVAPAPLAYSVARTTGHAYNSIASAILGGDGTGTLSTAAGDEGTQLVAWPGTPFQYQGQAVTGFRINANGFLQLETATYTTTTGSSWDNTLASFNGGVGTPDINKRNVIAPFYDDHNKPSPVIFYKISGNVATIEWFNTTHFGLSGPQMYFQVVLDGNDESITFNYGDMQLYNGTQNIRYAYTCGISGGFISGTPQPGEIMQQQYENTTIFTNENSTRANHGANGLAISPEPRSRIKFTPGVYVAAPAPLPSAPSNDESGGAALIPALSAFPSNIAWNNSLMQSNLFTTRYATSSAQPFCDASTGKRDVWFRFVASDPNTQVRIYPSGGFIPRMEIKDQFLADLAPVQCIVAAAQGGVITASLAGLTVGDDYYVRVYHNLTGTTALATANVSAGSVTSINVTTPGTNYPIVAQSFGYNPANTGPIVRLTGGGGNGAVAAVNTPTTTQILSSLTSGNVQVSNVGNGYSSAPTVTIDSPDWGVTGEFGIIVFAKPTNDDCNTLADNQPADLLNVGNGVPVNAQSLSGGSTTSGSTTVNVTSTAILGTPGPGNQWIISGPNIPLNTVATVTNATTLTLSVAATGTSSGLTLTARQNNLTFVTTGAATASAEAVCTGSPDDDLWYRFVATGASHTVLLQGRDGFDPAFTVYFGGSCLAKSLSNPNDPLVAGTCGTASVNSSGANGQETLNLTTTPGQTYYIRVYHAATGSLVGGTFDISVYTPLPLQYQMAQNTAAYTAITGGTVLATGTVDDVVYKVITTPKVRFNTSLFDSIFVHSNGWLQIQSSPGATTAYPLSVPGGFGALAALASNLEGASGAAEIRYQYVAPEHVVQWSDFRRVGVAGESFSFQIRMNATTGDVTYHYGGGTYGSGAVVVVGMRTDQIANTTTSLPAGATPATRPTGVFLLNRATLGSPANQDFTRTTTGFSPTSALALSAASNPPAGLRFVYTSSTCSPYPGVAATILTFDRGVSNTVRWRRVPGASGYKLRYRLSTDAVSASTEVPVGAVDTDTSYTFAPFTLSGSTYVVWDVATVCGALPTEVSHYSTPSIIAVQGDPIGYTVSRSSAAYSPITGGSVISFPVDQEDNIATVDISPATIRINDADYSQVTVSTNGFLVGGSVSLIEGQYNPLGSLVGLGIVSPLADDLDGDVQLDGECRWQDTGSEIVFQWSNWSRFVAGEDFNFQARYNKSSHVWTFAYENMNTMTAADSFQIGIRASTNQLRRDVIALTGAPDWSEIVMGNVAAAGLAKEFPTTSTNGPSNTDRLVFTPNACRGLPAAIVSVTSAPAPTPTAVIGKFGVTNLPWRRAVNPSASNSASSGYLVRYRSIGDPSSVATWATPTVVGSGENDTTTTLSGLNPGTQYVYQVAGRCSGVSATEFGPVGRFFTLPADNDIALTAIVSPGAGSGCFTTTTPVTVRITNTGNLVIPAGTSMNYNIIVTGPIASTLTGSFNLTANLAAGANVVIPVGNADMSTAGVYTFGAASTVTFAADENVGNDDLGTAANVTATTTITLTPPAVYNYGFNAIATDPGINFQVVSAPNAWIQGNGPLVVLRSAAPVGSIAPREGSGFAVVDDINQFFSTTRLVLPCMTVPSCYEARFWATRWRGDNNSSNILVKVSTDGGATWSGNQTILNVTTGRDTTQIRQFYGPATTPTWHQFSLDLGPYVGQTIRLAFEAENASGTSTNFGVDDFTLQPKVGDDVSFVTVLTPIPGGSCGSVPNSVSVRIRNKGCNTQTDIPVTVNVTGGSPATLNAVIPGPVLPDTDADIVVGNVIANAGAAVLIFSGNVLLPGDAFPGDNSISNFNVSLKPSPVLNLSVTNTNLVINATTAIGATATASSSATFANGTVFSITDNGATAGDSVKSNIVVPGTIIGGANTVKRVNINIQHTFTGDLDIFLRAPNGQRIQLSTDNGSSGDNFINTSFIPLATPGGTDITSGSAPFTGDFYPEDDFSTLTGPSAGGTWTLIVTDDAGGDVGNLLNWNIQFDNQIVSAQWTASPAFAGFPYNPPSPTVNVNWSSPTIGSATDLSLTTTIMVSDASGCSVSRDTTINWFSTNQWLGVNDGSANWNDPDNWFAFPKPPTATQKVTIPAVGSINAAGGTVLYPPKANLGITVGTVEMRPNSELQIGAGGNMAVVANWIGNNFGSSVTGTGKVTFVGATSQTVSSITNFNNLEVNKTGGTVNIAGIARVAGQLRLRNGTSNINVQPSGQLILTSSASGTGRLGVVPSGASITGNLTMERYIPAFPSTASGGWYFLGSPITGKNFTDWSDDFRVYGPASAYGSQGGGILPTSAQHGTIFEYRQAEHNATLDTAQKIGWRFPSGNIVNGAGYRVFINQGTISNQKFENIGSPKIGLTIFPTLTRNEYADCQPHQSPATVTCEEKDRGWNLLSNPYPCPINWDATAGWTKPGSMNNTFYVWNPVAAQYQAYLGTTGTPGTLLGGGAVASGNTNPNLIPSSQAFFVKLTSAGSYSATLQATETVKDTVNGAQFVRTNVAADQIRIRLTQNSDNNYRFDGMLRFDAASTFGFDQHKDVDAISGQNFSFHLVGENGEALLMNTVPVPAETKVIPMVVSYAGKSGGFTFDFPEGDLMANGAQVYLKDNYLGTLTSMTNGGNYPFNVNYTDGSATSDRFEIVISPSSVTGINKLVDGIGIGVYPNPVAGNSKVTISVRNKVSAEAVVSVVDMVGKTVMTTGMSVKANETSSEMISLDLPAGVYTVKVVTGGKTLTEKLVVR